MRVRPLLLIAAIFGGAALVSLFVVRQLPREGQRSAPAPFVAAPAPPGAISPALEPAPSAADGTVEVRVSAGGEPQAEAEVRLYLAPAEPGATWRRAGETRSGADGIARLFAAPGAYVAVARATGLAPARREVIRARGEGVTWTELALEPAASLEGRAFVTRGAPVTGAKVRAIPLVSRWPGFAPPSAPPEETAEVTVSDTGAFRLEGLTPGAWAVAVEAPGHHPVLLSRVTVPGDALAVAVEPLGSLEGVVLDLDGRPAPGAAVRAASADHSASATTGAEGRFLLAAPAGTYALQATLAGRAGAAPAPVAVVAGEIARGAEIRLGAAAALDAEVALAAGGPLAGAQVALFAHGAREPVARVVAGRDGRATLAGLPPGVYDVRAAAPGASPALLAGVTLTAGARFPLRIALAGTGALEGTVLDAAGRPLAGARVRIVQRGDGIVAAPPLEARSDFEGRFRIEGVEVGRAEVVARQEGVLVGASRAVRVAAGRAARVDLSLAEPGFLVGRVTQAGRTPPAGTTVVAVAMKAGPGTLQVARAAADAGGGYRLALPAGEYRVHAAPGHVARTDLRVTPAYARVEAHGTAMLDLSVANVAPEEGVEVVVLEPGGAPSPGAVVTLARPDDPRIALATSAGEDGRVALGSRMGMVGRAVTIRARNGGRTGEETLTLPAGGTVAVRLRPGGAVEGVVRGGGRVSGFTLEIASQPNADGWRTVDVHRFAGDRFELADLPSEPLRLVVRAEDGRRGAAEVRVAAGETRAVEIALAK
jgi:hypothetical protein